MLRLHRIAQRKPRKLHTWLEPAVRWRGRDAVAERVDRNDEIFCAIDKFSWSNAGLKLFGRAAGPRRKDNHIRLVGVEMAKCSIADAAVANHAAVLEFEITDVRELLLLGKSDQREQLQRKQTTNYTDYFHLFLEDNVVHQDHAVLRRTLIAVGADADGS